MQDDFSGFKELLAAGSPWKGHGTPPEPDSDDRRPEVSRTLRAALEDARAAARGTDQVGADELAFCARPAPPRSPAASQLDAVRAHVRAHGPISLTPLDPPEPLAPIQTAWELLELSDAAEREAVRREDYDDEAKAIYPPYTLFVEAVARAARP